MLKLWTRHDAADSWGLVAGKGFDSIRDEEQGKALVRILQRKYPRAEFRLSETKPED